MSDRLDELRRQRALQREHLEWLDREIAALEADLWESQGAPPVIGEQPERGDAEDILAQYGSPRADIERQTRTGCLIYFAAAVVLLAIVLAAMYVHIRSARAH